MKVKWYGHACFRLEGRPEGNGGQQVAIVTDPYTPEISGYDPIPEPADVVIMSSATDTFHSCGERVPGNPIVINALEIPEGGREAKGVRFQAIAVMESLIHKTDPDENAMYTFSLDGIRVGHMGDVGNRLGEAELSLLRGVDVLLALTGGPPVIELPDLQEALQEIRPRVIIPMHYRTPKVKIPRILDVEAFTSLFPASRVERPGRTEIELTRETLPQEPKVVVLEHAWPRSMRDRWACRCSCAASPTWRPGATFCPTRCGRSRPSRAPGWAPRRGASTCSEAQTRDRSRPRCSMPAGRARC
jgi:L-ascorbate metabolism protein UlaG (beta-lactamase superfamily)